jgi:hypothetical protein
MNPNNIPPLTTSILHLRNADWDKVRNDVTDRIDYLEEVVRGLEPDPLSDKIATDLIAPALYTLSSFICSVEIEEPLPASIQRRHSELRCALLEQDLDEIRSIITKGGDAAAVLLFLNTPTA